MAYRRFSLLFLCLLALHASCSLDELPQQDGPQPGRADQEGEKTLPLPSPTLCTPAPSPSERFVLTFVAHADLRRNSPGEQVLLENGHQYFLVDDHCHYWAYDSFGKHRGWEPRVEGQLNTEQAETLLDRLKWPDGGGPARPEKEVMPTHQTSSAMKAFGESIDIACAVCEGSPVQQVLKELVKQGNEPIPTSLRYIMEKVGEESLVSVQNIPPHPFPPGPLKAFEHGEVAELGRGQSLLFEDEQGVEELWSLRTEYMTWSQDRWWYGYVPLIDDQGNRYTMRFRTTSKIEDDRGLIPALIP